MNNRVARESLAFLALLLVSTVFVIVLAITGLDEPDVESSVLRYVQMLDLNLNHFAIVEACKTIIGRHLSYQSCNLFLEKIIFLKLVQFVIYVFSAMTVLIILWKKIPQNRALYLTIFFPSVIYFSTTFSTEAIVYLFTILIPLARFKLQALFVIIIISLDIGNGIVAFIYLVIYWMAPRKLLMTFIFACVSIVSGAIITFVLDFVTTGKLFDVLNYTKNIVVGDFSIGLLYLPKMILSALFLTPDFVGVFSSSFFIISIFLALIKRHKLHDFLRSFLSSPSILTVILMIGFLPAHAYGKYYLFVVTELVVMLLAYLNWTRIYYMQIVFMIAIICELLLWSVT